MIIFETAMEEESRVNIESVRLDFRLTEFESDSRSRGETIRLERDKEILKINALDMETESNELTRQTHWILVCGGRASHR